MRQSDTDITIGIEASLDKTWLAGMLYLRNVIHALASLPEADKPRVRLLPINADSAAAVADLEDTYGFVTVASPNLTHRRFADAWLVGRRLMRRGQYLVGRPIAPAFKGLSATFPDWGKPIPNIPQIAWIPDFQHLHLPEMFSSDEIERRTKRIARIAQSEGTVVLSSHSAERDFVSVHPQPRVDVRVWRFCSSITERDLVEQGRFGEVPLPTFYLYVGNQFWAHKGHLTLFEALCLLREHRVTPAVVCTGLMNDPRNPAYAQQVLDFLQKNELKGQVTLLGVLERSQQIRVLRHAAAVVQPSRFEGWSTLVEDARAVGRPVLLSDIPVHREQLPEGEFFRVDDASSLAAALQHLLSRIAPGPDHDKETVALAELRDVRARRGQEFLAIVRAAADHIPARSGATT